MPDLSTLALQVSIWALPLIFAITLHEAAHGYAARLFGDRTAEMEGRISLNPVRHIDPFGTLLLPAMLLAMGGVMFGWAKPVPVDFTRLQPRRLGMVLVALAGPMTNLFLAILSVLLLYVAFLMPQTMMEWMKLNLMNSIYLNLLLMVFNLLPLPPLDGGRVAVGILPRQLAMPLARLENAGIFILIGLMFLLPMAGNTVGLDLNIFGWLIGTPVAWLSGLLLHLFGLI